MREEEDRRPESTETENLEEETKEDASTTLEEMQDYLNEKERQRNEIE